MEFKILGLAMSVRGLLIGGISPPNRFVHLPMVRNPEGRPYVPASSFKGRLRMLIERFFGLKPPKDEEECASLEGSAKLVAAFFGGCKNLGPTRLYFQDLLPVEYKVELKAENYIDRTTGKAENPRVVERVYGTFVGSITFLVDYTGISEEEYKRFVREILPLGFKLLKLIGLGRGVSRGYGKIERIKAKRLDEEEREKIMLEQIRSFEGREDVEKVLRGFP